MTEGVGATIGRPRLITQSRAIDRALGKAPLFALLLPAYPVVLLYGDNVTDVSPPEVAGAFVVVLGVATLGLVILARVSHSWTRAGLLVVSTLVPFLLAGLVGDIVEAGWLDEHLLRLHAILVSGWFALTALGVYVSIKLSTAHLTAVTRLLNTVSIALIVVATFPLVADLPSASVTGAKERPVLVLAGSSLATDSAAPRRDIYHLVFDRYGSERSLALGEGIDNSHFVAWLRERGFQVVDDARANFERTVLSLSSVHHMSLHQDLMGSGTYDQLVARIRSSRAASALKDVGYEYVVAGSWWGPSASSGLADRTVKPRYVMTFTSALVDRSLVPSLEALASFVTSASFDPSEQKVATTTQNQFASLHRLAGEPGPQLVFAHVLVPHEPYVFLADGTVDPNVASYETQLRYTNEQLMRLIEPLLALPLEERPIIVLQADEGPYPERYEDGRDDFDWSTATDEEIVAKFGVLDAFYLPGDEGEPPIRDGLSLANTYPEILRRYFGLEVDLLADRTFAMVGGDLFDLVDITERVDAAFSRLVPPGGANTRR